MDLDALRESLVGALVPISGPDSQSDGSYDYFAYLASPLPKSGNLQ
jgi:hypothetical protein